LRSIVETIMIDAMYEIPSSHKKNFEVTKAYAQEKLEIANFDVLK
ncbi:MAG: ATP-dependent Clp protease ATP-binding subunit ClpX, partial [Muribaculaceae bacterium]